MTKGNLLWRFLLSLSSAVMNSQPSRSARADPAKIEADLEIGRLPAGSLKDALTARAAAIDKGSVPDRAFGIDRGLHSGLHVPGRYHSQYR